MKLFLIWLKRLKIMAPQRTCSIDGEHLPWPTPRRPTFFWPELAVARFKTQFFLLMSNYNMIGRTIWRKERRRNGRRPYLTWMLFTRNTQQSGRPSSTCSSLSLSLSLSRRVSFNQVGWIWNKRKTS
jgi:hypothetical protein